LVKDAVVETGNRRGLLTMKVETVRDSAEYVSFTVQTQHLKYVSNVLS